MEVDPDYAFDISEDPDEEASQARRREEDAKEAVTNKIRNIIKKQFMQEIAAKESEITFITERLTEARNVLDRLRACVVASYYASSFAKPLEKNKPEVGAAQHPAIQNVLRKAVTSVLSKNLPPEPSSGPAEPSQPANDSLPSRQRETSYSPDVKAKEHEILSKTAEFDGNEEQSITSPPTVQLLPPSLDILGGRHRIKKTIIVGNVSKYIAPDKREGNDKSTHKWMVYVRGTADEPRIDHFVRKVWFFLHPSYRPNDLVEVTEAPFHLTRRGWGEFPIRVQLHFCDPRNRRIDIIHQLRLDRTYTGLQTLGAETVCEVELDRSTVGLKVENLLDEQAITSCDADVDSSQHPVIRAKDDMKGDSEPADDAIKANEAATEIESHLRSDLQKNEDASSFGNHETDGAKIKQKPSVEPARDLNNGDDDISGIDKEVVLRGVHLAEHVNGSDKSEKDVTAMDVDEAEEPEEENVVIESSTTTPDKRRRRRRGDSCSLNDPSDHAKPEKSLARRLLCSDDDDDDDDGSDSELDKSDKSYSKEKRLVEDNNASKLQSRTDESAFNRFKNTTGADSGFNSEVGKSAMSVDGEPSISEATDADDKSNGNAASIRPMSVRESKNSSSELEAVIESERTSSSCSVEDEVCAASTPDESDQTEEKSTSSRSRSLSADSAALAFSSMSGSEGKIVCLKKCSPVKTSSTSPTGSGKSSVVVLRPRSTSTDYPLQKFTQTTKGNITIITPIAHKAKDFPGQKPMIVGRKRSLGGSSSNGAVVLSMVPEKQRKVNKDASIKPPSVPTTTTKIAIPISSLVKPSSIPPSPSTSVIGKMSLSVQNIKPQSATSSNSTNEVHLRLGGSGVTLVPTSKIRPESSERTNTNGNTKMPAKKSYVLKNTKQGLVVVSQNLPTKESTTTKEPKETDAETRKTSPKSSSSTIADQAVNQTIVSDQNTTTPEENSTTGKSASLRNPPPLKALQSAFLNATLNANRSVQFKLEKSGSNQLMPSLANQQFVLTTITNDQGKQQLALVSTDRLKHSTKSKPRVNISAATNSLDSFAPSNSSNVPVKSEHKQHSLPTWGLGKLNHNENIPFYQVVGNKIISWKAKDMLREALPLAARFVPLVKKGRKVSELPFCAESEADFLEWNVGKQRASEMQRAALIRKILIYIRDKSEYLKDEPIPSKRVISEWCLMRGYSVFTDEYEVNEESETNKGANMEMSLSCHNLLIQKLKEAHTDNNTPRTDTYDDVDIVSVSPPNPLSIKIKEEPSETKAMDRRFRITPTTEMRAVDRIAGEIDVKFNDVPVADNLDAPLCQVILAKALELFTRDLTREALASSLIRRDGSKRIQRVLPDRIETEDLLAAVTGGSPFRILTDEYMAIDNSTPT